MAVDLQHFTPYSALVGGALIGLGAAILLFFNGRICGVSGILGNALFGAKGDRLWRFFFLGGLVCGGALTRQFYPAARAFELLLSSPLIVLAGVLVGFGTQLGGGCTSGHGVCGIARLSKRSLAATGIFMLFGFATVYFARHLL